MRTIQEPPRQLGRDPREGEPWFRELPEAAKNDIRAQWEREERTAGVGQLRRKEQGIQCVIEGVTLHFLVQLLVYSMSPFAAVVTIGVGFVTGLAWHWAPPHRSVAALVGIASFFVVRLILGMGSPLMAVFAITLVMCGSAAMAIPRQSARMGA